MTGISTTRAVERCERLAALGPAPAWWRVFAMRRWLAEYRAIMALDISVHAEMLRSLYTPAVVIEAARRPNTMFSAALDGELCLCGAGAHVIRPMRHETCPIYKPAGAA